jgi:hypothetical protein
LHLSPDPVSAKSYAFGAVFGGFNFGYFAIPAVDCGYSESQIKMTFSQCFGIFSGKTTHIFPLKKIEFL